MRSNEVDCLANWMRYVVTQKCIDIMFRRNQYEYLRINEYDHIPWNVMVQCNSNWISGERMEEEGLWRGGKGENHKSSNQRNVPNLFIGSNCVTGTFWPLRFLLQGLFAHIRILYVHDASVYIRVSIEATDSRVARFTGTVGVSPSSGWLVLLASVSSSRSKVLSIFFSLSLFSFLITFDRTDVVLTDYVPSRWNWER